ncbi:hypothetical protein [Rhodobacter ferrooxidans]|uniref:D-alanyl-D-alanine carboxypeptidase/D-alanyl-D-alanine-endopeptidase n=1 Tax=Rhodobacter ferrooxidans TaxID=371731 RepID=C8S2V5_9RHOB|nr:hypothetical protein [Rhodobacter sp. SW2]EEW24595.1 D-alanyl-D-alanine carboxypeptidase/D-alanyl-D-alanine-endopeptidase [Rhodobacter sp. SW2]
MFAVICTNTDRRDRLPMSQREEPEGGHDWTKRARLLQAKLVSRWAEVYG